MIVSPSSPDTRPAPIRRAIPCIPPLRVFSNCFLVLRSRQSRNTHRQSQRYHQYFGIFHDALLPLVFTLASHWPIQIKLRFSEPMDDDWEQFDVQIRQNEKVLWETDNDPTDWSSSDAIGTGVIDTWTSDEIDVPDDGSWDGQLTVAVRARRRNPDSVVVGLDVFNQELDTTGSGSSSPNTYDTSVNIPLGRSLFVVGGPFFDVWQEGARNGLKFREGPLITGRAGRASLIAQWIGPLSNIRGAGSNDTARILARCPRSIQRVTRERCLA